VQSNTAWKAQVDLREEAIVLICDWERRSVTAAFQSVDKDNGGLLVCREMAIYELVALSSVLCAIGRGMMYVRALAVVTMG
jgi:hypothetical protein